MFEAVKHTDAGVTVTLAGGKTLDAELLLVAVGRGPVSAGLGYEEEGVAIDRGFVMVDEYCQTNVADVYAVGDLIPTLQLAHVGFAEGILVAEHIAGLPVAPIDYDGVPRVTYSDPEVASVGLTEAKAAERGADDVEVNYNLAGNGRSEILKTQGEVKVIAELAPRIRPGRVVGIHIVGDRVGELIAEAQLIYNWDASPRTWPSSSTRTRPSPRPSARRTSRWPASRCTSTTSSSPSPPRLPPPSPPKESRDMSVSVSMPQLGESVTEGTVTRWLKKEGERVEVDEPLLEVSTDKVDTEIPSPASGILRNRGRRGRDGRRRRAARRHAARPARRRPQPTTPPAAPARWRRGRAGARPAGAAGRAGTVSAARRRHRWPGRGCRPPLARTPTPAAASPRPALAGRPCDLRPRSRAPGCRPPLRLGSRAAAAEPAEEYPPPTPLPSARRRALRHPAGAQARRRARRGPGHRHRHRRRRPHPQAGRHRGRPCQARRAAAPLRRQRCPARRAAQSPAQVPPAQPSAAGRPAAPAPRPAAAPPRCAARPSRCRGCARSSPSGWSSRCSVSAQLTTVVEVDVTAIARLRERGQARLRGPRGRQAVLPAVLRARCRRGAEGAPEAQRVDRRGPGHLP